MKRVVLVSKELATIAVNAAHVVQWKEPREKNRFPGTSPAKWFCKDCEDCWIYDKCGNEIIWVKNGDAFVANKALVLAADGLMHKVREDWKLFRRVKEVLGMQTQNYRDVKESLDKSRELLIAAGVDMEEVK